MDTAHAREQAVMLATDALTETLGHPIQLDVTWKLYEGTHPVGVISRRIRGLVEDAFRTSPEAQRVEVPPGVLGTSAIAVWVASISAQVAAPAPDIIVPQANSFERLEAFMVAWANTTPIDETTERTVAYYAELAEFLGWVTRDRDGVHLTARGLAWLGLDAQAKRVEFGHDLRATPLMQQVAAFQASGSTLHEALHAVIAKTGLSEATVVRRTNAVASLVAASQVVFEPPADGLGDEPSIAKEPEPWFFQGISRNETAPEPASVTPRTGRRADAI